MTGARWLATDWGATSLRVWAMAGREVQAEGASELDLERLAPADFEPALLALADSMLPPDEVTPVLACGLAGARHGWVEVPYAPLPCCPSARQPVRAPSTDPRLSVGILPGLCQTEPPDVMRGEETRVAGFLAARPEFDGTLCLPGTHSKWIRLCGGMILAFRTAMTGELYRLLVRASTLRRAFDDIWNDGLFHAAVDEVFHHPERMPGALFSLRASALLDPRATGQIRGRLSGLLIGSDLAAMRDLWQGHPVAVLGSERLSQLYVSALSEHGAEVETVAPDRLTLEGLIATFEQTGAATLTAP
ncbi:2-dehydro-3-deoxygalactonokinase [Rhodovulum sp. MB263]|uniref:2-dehydro-3-deoxygalactonokinase n=1 Tax=Rhodovulum sp. (strain MB263) TaxID=308754 RepID=UPI0009B7DEE3|nr:2-dehydro-3-deoxygalactonokinase [Rhodovulum sp. MB263]ARC88354.1 hypothetical protein B5V46_06875 [Rhodovulum sp. MB263]